AVKLERNIQPLSDDYIKFIRFAHWKMEKVERGVIGIITNNSFIDGLIHRGMRQELMKDFDEIYIFNLHGNSRIGEKCPDGTKDENVFDIMQGVCISFFIKKSSAENKQAKVFYQDLHGLRQVKYAELFGKTIKTVKWKKLKPDSNYHFFALKDFSSNGNYLNCFKINEIFNLYTSGIKTHHDNELIAFKPFKTNNQLYNYRPFDIRFIEYDLKKVVRHRNSIMQNMLKDNLGLCITRQVNREPFHHSFISDCLTDICFVSIRTKESAYIFSLYTYNENKIENGNGNDYLFKEDGKRDNFTKDFRHYIKSKYLEHFSPNQILGYIYAVLHSPTYRTKYIEFLKIDFPRIPFTEDENKFQELSIIGEKLINAHLMKEIPAKITCPLLGGSNNFKVESVNFDKGKVWFNNERYFDNVPEDVWNFYIGGYQVLEKWFKERKKHEITLTPDDFSHFRAMVNVINFTIKTMGIINELTKEWI
ncbi:MAG: methylase, partial [Ignavibacteria bacterium]|nr:methylase [Ignavibacteria bacterium]